MFVIKAKVCCSIQFNCKYYLCLPIDNDINLNDNQMDRYFLIGFMGSGKTTIGKIVSERTGYKFIDMDELIESREHESVSCIFATRGEEYFRNLERDYLHELSEQEHVIIATGGGVPCFFDNMDYMNSVGCTIYLKFSPEQLKRRLELCDPTTRPLLTKRKGDDLLRYIKDTLVLREPYYSRASCIVEGDDCTIAEQVIALLA